MYEWYIGNGLYYTGSLFRTRRVLEDLLGHLDLKGEILTVVKIGFGPVFVREV